MKQNLIRRQLLFVTTIIIIAIVLFTTTIINAFAAHNYKYNTKTNSVQIQEPIVETVTVEKIKTVEVSKRQYYDIPLSEYVQDTIFDECEKYNISPALVIAMIYQESRFDDTVIGDNGKSYGLMQIQKRYHKDRMTKLGCTDLLDPTQNIKVGIDLLAELKTQNDNIFWVLMAYNGGISYANKQIKNNNINNYARDVIIKSHELNIVEK